MVSIGGFGERDGNRAYSPNGNRRRRVQHPVRTTAGRRDGTDAVRANETYARNDETTITVNVTHSMTRQAGVRIVRAARNKNNNQHRPTKY